MIALSSPLRGPLVVTPHGNYGADRPLRKGTHLGLDFAVKLGDAVLSAAPGTVARQGWDKPVKEGGGGGGNYVITRHVDAAGNVFELGYMHLQSILVATGKSLQAGDELGTAGATGTADGGVHLHFQMKSIEGGVRRAIDPTALFQLGGAAPTRPASSASSGGLVALLVTGVGWLLKGALFP